LRKEGWNPIYREKASGAQPTRRELLRMLKVLGPGDGVTVTRIDRVARSRFDLFAIVKQIVDAGGQFRSLAEPWADTTTSTGRLLQHQDLHRLRRGQHALRFHTEKGRHDRGDLPSGCQVDRSALFAEWLRADWLGCFSALRCDRSCTSAS
jgi:hypothetical protein